MRLIPSLALLGALSACPSDKAAAPSEPRPSTAEAAPAPKTPAVRTGRIEGTVLLADGADLPTLPDPRAASKLAVVEPPAPCTPIGADDDLTPVKRDSATGGLSFVHLAITGMKEPPTHPPRVHELRLENCRLDRALIAAQPGDSVRITNASKAPLLPGIVGSSFMEAILAGASRTIELKQPGAPRIACSFGAYCGQTDVMVTAHSLVAVTDRTGHYRIDNVPLDQEITLHAWHPLFEESHEAFKLTEAEPTRTIQLRLKPAPVRVQAKPVEPEPGQVVIH